MNIEINFHNEDEGGQTEVTLRQIGLGIQPLVLIEPEIDEETEAESLIVQASIMDLDDLEAVLECVLEGIRSAKKRMEAEEKV